MKNKAATALAALAFATAWGAAEAPDAMATEVVLNITEGSTGVSVSYADGSPVPEELLYPGGDSTGGFARANVLFYQTGGSWVGQAINDFGLVSTNVAFAGSTLENLDPDNYTLAFFGSTTQTLTVADDATNFITVGIWNNFSSDNLAFSAAALPAGVPYDPADQVVVDAYLDMVGRFEALQTSLVGFHAGTTNLSGATSVTSSFTHLMNFFDAGAIAGASLTSGNWSPLYVIAGGTSQPTAAGASRITLSGISEVPEPATFALLGAGLAALVAGRPSRRSQ